MNSENKLSYFGTNADSAGHYFWQVSEHGLYNSNLNFKQCPFDPEKVVSSYDKKGKCVYNQVDGFTYLAIVGSAIDQRPGCKSVFFVNELIDVEEIIRRIKSYPHLVKLIEKMPFEIIWPTSKQQS